MTKNTSFNDICITKIINLIQPDLDRGESKLWYIRYIINLIAIAFIFDNKLETFKIDIVITKNTNNLEAVMKLWKKQNAIRKLHNLIQFIWVLSQRKAIFINIAKFFFNKADKLNNGKNDFTIINNNQTSSNSTYLAI